MTSIFLLASTLFFSPLAHASLLDSVVDQAANATSELSRRIFGNVQGKNLLGGADYPGNDNKESSGQYWYDSATPIDQCPDTTGDINQANRLWGKLNSIVYTGKNFANNGNLPDVTQFVCFNVDAWRLNQGNGDGKKNVNDNSMKATADHMGLKIAARYGAFNRVLLIPRPNCDVQTGDTPGWLDIGASDPQKACIPLWSNDYQINTKDDSGKVAQSMLLYVPTNADTFTCDKSLSETKDGCTFLYAYKPKEEDKPAEESKQPEQSAEPSASQESKPDDNNDGNDGPKNANPRDGDGKDGVTIVNNISLGQQSAQLITITSVSMGPTDTQTLTYTSQTTYSTTLTSVTTQPVILLDKATTSTSTVVSSSQNTIYSVIWVDPPQKTS